MDWNGNGRDDWGDGYIDYEIMNDIDSNEEHFSNGDGCSGCLLVAIVIAIILIIF